MTREEAIKNIKEHCYFANLIPQAKEALDMAIEALEQEPCEDCISKKAVLDKINEVCFSREQDSVDFRVAQGSNGQRDLIINFIENLPSVMLDDVRSEWWNAPYKRSAEKADRKEIDWISIDENVPINGQRVLVCFDDGFILIGAYMDYAEDEKEPYWVFDGEEDFNLEDAQVIAWVPLPESYKEESEE